MANSGIILTSTVICGPGMRRSTNQDNYYLNGAFRQDVSDRGVKHIHGRAYDRAIYAVADGMGGEQHGEKASLMAVRGLSGVDVNIGAEAVYHYLIKCNDELCRFISENNGVRSGTTFVGLCFRGKTFEVINIGDSRAYLLRGNVMKQLSKDHTVVQSLLKMGVITEAELYTHPERHKLTQHLGIFPDEMLIEPYAAVGELEPNDLFLLCSDGVYDMIDDKAIKRLMQRPGSLEDKALSIYSAAMENGGKDNITVMLILAQEDDPDEELLSKTI